MLVYHVEVIAHSTKFGSLQEKDSHFCNVYLTHDEAFKSGKEWLDNRIERLYKSSDYCDGKEDSLTLQDFLNDGFVYYRFIVTEIDVKLWKTYNYPRKDKHLHKPPHVEYEYDLNGELLQSCYVYYLDNVPFSYLQRREGDDEPTAGTKFKMGDFVRLKRPLVSDFNEKYDTKQIFVISGIPSRDENGVLIENCYHVDTVGKNGEYKWAVDFHYPFQGIHESELEAVSYHTMINSDDIDDVNTPLWFLQRLMRGEVENQQKILQKLRNGEISLDSNSLWYQLAEHKNWQPQAKFYAIEVKSDTDLFEGMPDCPWEQGRKTIELANAADELFQSNGKQSFIAISRLKEGFVDLFAICKPEVSEHWRLQDLTSNGCEAFGINFTELKITEIDGQNFYKRLRHSEVFDYTNDWVAVLEDFGIEPYHFEGDYATTPRTIGEAPY